MNTTYRILLSCLAACFTFQFSVRVEAQQHSTHQSSISGKLDVGGGIHLFYEKIGNGKQKIIIPLGFWLSQDFASLVNTDRTLVFYDMRGRGSSSYVKDSTKITIQQEVEDLEKLRQFLGFEKVNLIGESYLGFMVILYAMKYPQHVDNIVQIGAIPYRVTNQYPDSLKYAISQVNPAKYKVLETKFHQSDHIKNPKEFSYLYWNTVDKVNLVHDTTYFKNMKKQWGDQFEYQNEWFVNFSRHIGALFQSILKTEITPEDLTSVRQRVLTIHGRSDRNVAYGAGKEWASLLPNARLLTIPKAGHIPWIENPTLVFSSINTFLNGIWPQQSKKPNP